MNVENNSEFTPTVSYSSLLDGLTAWILGKPSEPNSNGMTIDKWDKLESKKVVKNNW